MRMNLDHVTSGHFVLAWAWERFFASSCSLNYWPLAVSMPPTKVCPQCKAAVPVRQKTCERCDHVFRSERKAECNLREKAMKRMRAVESDSVKSARKVLYTHLFYPQFLPNILYYITPVSITSDSPVTLSLVISLTSSCLACIKRPLKI